MERDSVKHVRRTYSGTRLAVEYLKFSIFDSYLLFVFTKIAKYPVQAFNFFFFFCLF